MPYDFTLSHAIHSYKTWYLKPLLDTAIDENERIAIVIIMAYLDQAHSNQAVLAAFPLMKKFVSRNFSGIAETRMLDTIDVCYQAWKESIAEEE